MAIRLFLERSGFHSTIPYMMVSDLHKVHNRVLALHPGLCIGSVHIGLKSSNLVIENGNSDIFNLNLNS